MLLLVAIAIVVAVATENGPALVVGIALLVITGMATGLAWSLPARIYRRWSYRIDDVAIEVSRGALIRRRSVIPFFRIQHVDTSRGPLERKLGLTELKLHTASSGTDAQIPGLDDAVATELRAHIVARAGLSDGV
ncbi:MAG: PH domain-containing protein [Acidimicrobiales bacterium]|nr:PH domain-containing protein [Acidimicrobiales bacterium]